MRKFKAFYHLRLFEGHSRQQDFQETMTGYLTRYDRQSQEIAATKEQIQSILTQIASGTGR